MIWTKVVNLSKLPYPELIDYTKNEIQLLAKFTNAKSYIIKLYDSQITEDNIFMVFEVLIIIGS
jgi:serine/threonine protein kinase